MGSLTDCGLAFARDQAPGRLVAASPTRLIEAPAHGWRAARHGRHLRRPLEAGNRQSTFVRDAPHVAREAGDGFAVLLPTDPPGAQEAAAVLQQAMSPTFHVEATPLPQSVSMGIAVYPDDGGRPRLMAQAALAARRRLPAASGATGAAT